MVDEEEKVTEWIELMKNRLDEYEVERNEFTANYQMPPKDVMFYRELILPFVENTLIMDNIAASEGIMYDKCGCENRLVIRCFINSEEIQATYPLLKHFRKDNECRHDYKGEQINYPEHFPFLLESDPDPEGNKKPAKTLYEAFNKKELTKEDVEICLPSEHAFYSILENFIRNSAKHNKSKLNDGKTVKHGKLEICININKSGDDLYQVDLYDNVSAVPVSVLQKIVAGKKQSILNDEGELKRENLGIADMKINAHLLQSSQNISDDLLDEHLNIILLQSFEDDDHKSCAHQCDKDKIHVFNNLEATEEVLPGFIDKKDINPQYPENDKNDKDHYRFGYRFHLAKSKKVCWIGKKDINEEAVKSLNNKGIYLFKDTDDFLKQKNGSLAAYQFAILEPTIFNDWNFAIENVKREKLEDKVEKFLLKLPFRILLNNEDDIEIANESILGHLLKDRRIHVVDEPIKLKDDKDNISSYYILKGCWENWLSWYGNEKKLNGELVVYSEDEFDNWKEAIKKFNSEKFNFIYATCKLSKNDLTSELIPKVFWDHHGKSGIFDKSIFPKKQTFLSHNCYLEFGKTNPDFSTISLQKADEESLFPYKLFEAGLLRVLVIDERFTEFAALLSGRNPDRPLKRRGFSEGKIGKQNEYNTLNFDACWASNVFITTHIDQKPLGSSANNNLKHKLNLNLGLNEVQDSNSSSIKIETSFNEKYDYNEDDQVFDVVVIHKTYLNDEYKESVRCNLQTDRFLRLLKKEIPSVIVTSGGSSQHGIKGTFKFISINELKKNFVNGKGIAKLRFSERIMNLTKKEG